MCDKPATAAGARLCALGDLAATGAKGLVTGTGSARREIVVIQHGDGALAYVNRCPHQGTPLEITPDRFLDGARRTIICSTHGARFRASDGYCYSGPCNGLSLEPVPVRVVDGEVWLVP